MHVLISDANILIDLEVGGIIEGMFDLPYEFITPDILFEQELRRNHAHLLNLGLRLGELTGESMMYAYELNAQNSQPSLNDAFALALAKQQNCPLLTGDLNLRKMAESEAVIVKGTLWLVEQLVIHSVISVEVALSAYDQMANHCRRLPFDMAKKRINEVVQ